MKLPFLVLCMTAIGMSTSARSSELVVKDAQLDIAWTIPTSPELASWKHAFEYCRDLELAGYSDWRLPSRSELESIVNHALRGDHADTKAPPLYGPFTEPSSGYLFSGTLVEGYEDAPYVMNIRNGHIFNGKGYVGLARCVQDLRFE